VTCIGELLWDVLPSGRKLGGAPANVAYHLSRLGVPVRLVTRVGRDESGLAAEHELQSKSLPTGDLQWDDALPTGTARVNLDASGQADYRFETPAAWDAIALPEFTPEVLVFGSLAQRDARSRRTVRQLAAGTPVCVYDVNLRPPYTALEHVVETLPLATIVKLNEDEAGQLAGALGWRDSLPALAEALAARYGLRAVCITRGAAGAALWADGRWFDAPAVPIASPDSVGAGDAFLAALVRGWLVGNEPLHVLEQANRIGAYVASRPGAMPDYDSGADRC
jgi:fructokinase